MLGGIVLYKTGVDDVDSNDLKHVFEAVTGLPKNELKTVNEPFNDHCVVTFTSMSATKSDVPLKLISAQLREEIIRDMGHKLEDQTSTFYF